jgi:hypothetical protein
MKAGLPDGTFSNQKIPIWANFGGLWNRQCWFILWPFEIVYSHLVCFLVIWYISWEFVKFSTALACCAKKNLATLNESRRFIDKFSVSFHLMLTGEGSSGKNCNYAKKRIKFPTKALHKKIQLNASKQGRRCGYVKGLPDSAWYKVPKLGEIYQMATKYTKRS